MPQSSTHTIKGVLCRFDGGSGFYSINLLEEDALQGAMAGRFDAKGLAEPMSQFIRVEACTDGRWKIHVPSPDQNVFVSAMLQQPTFVAGVTDVDEKIGFCLLSDDTLEHQDDIKTV